MTKPLQIAVADDEQDMRDFFERMLPLCGHQVVAVAETGRELVEHCRSLRPDLVITDIKMPDMDGIEAAVEICRERPLPIILVSAHHDSDLIQRAAADHIMGYLVKPIGKVDLDPAIALAVRRFQQFEAVRQEASDLRQALADRKIIEQAKGVLMKITGADEKDAFHRLQQLAAERNQKLIEAAQSVITMEKAFRRPDAGHA
jgi:two-component system, response regulator PdtaR